MKNIASLLVVFVTTFSLLMAQPNRFDQAVADWYQEERFLMADRNEDALLDLAELQAFSFEFGYFLEGDHFRIADLNKDQRLSFNEIRQRSYSEMMYRYNQDQIALQRLARDYPLLSQADISYLKGQPTLAAQLFSNYLWMYKNEPLTEKLLSDKIWLARHPEVSLALHQNLRWMAAHPRFARALYGDRAVSRQLPHLQGWRASHLGFIPTYPRLEMSYDGSFLPAGVQRR